MEINADTTGGEAAAALIGSLGSGASKAPTKLTVAQQQAVTDAVETLLAQAGIVDTDTVQVHFAANPDGKWAVLRVAHVIREE